MGGSISDKNTRTLITIDKEFKAELEKLAKEQNRSFSNLVITALKEYREKHSHDWFHGIFNLFLIKVTFYCSL